MVVAGGLVRTAANIWDVFTKVRGIMSVADSRPIVFVL